MCSLTGPACTDAQYCLASGSSSTASPRTRVPRAPWARVAKQLAAATLLMSARKGTRVKAWQWWSERV